MSGCARSYLRALVVALLLGAAAGVIAASFMTVVEGEGLEIRFGS